MKLSNIVSALLLFVYSVLAIGGVGMFHCGCTNTQRWVLLTVQNNCPPCDGYGENCCRHSDRHSHDNDDDDCCSLEYKYLGVDQSNDSGLHDAGIPKITSLDLFSSFSFTVSGIRESYLTVRNNSPPDLLKIPLIFLHCRLRL